MSRTTASTDPPPRLRHWPPPVWPSPAWLMTWWTHPLKALRCGPPPPTADDVSTDEIDQQTTGRRGHNDNQEPDKCHE